MDDITAFAAKAPATGNEHPFWLCQYGRSGKDVAAHQIRLKSDITCIQYVISGSGVVISNNHSFRVNKGDTFLLHEETDHNYYSYPDNQFERIWINFKGPLGKELIKLYNLENTIILKNTDSSSHLRTLHNICKSTSEPEEYKKKTAVAFLELIQFLSERKIINSDMDDPIDYIRLYIDCHITENIKLADIANFSHTSKEYIIRSFKKKYKTTPHQYILQSKMKIADAMLRSTNKSIEEISAELSFSDPHHFSSQFLKFAGVRPSTYRKNYHAQNKNI